MIAMGEGTGPPSRQAAAANPRERKLKEITQMLEVAQKELRAALKAHPEVLESPKAREALKKVETVLQGLQELCAEESNRSSTSRQPISEEGRGRKRSLEAASLSERTPGRARLEADHSIPRPRDRPLESIKSTSIYNRPRQGPGGRFGGRPRPKSPQEKKPQPMLRRRAVSDLPKWQGSTTIGKPSKSWDGHSRDWESRGTASSRRGGRVVQGANAPRHHYPKGYASMPADLGRAPKSPKGGPNSISVMSMQHTSSSNPRQDLTEKGRIAGASRFSPPTDIAPAAITTRGLRPPERITIDVGSVEPLGSEFRARPDYRNPPRRYHEQPPSGPIDPSGPSGPYLRNGGPAEQSRFPIGSSRAVGPASMYLETGSIARRDLFTSSGDGRQSRDIGLGRQHKKGIPPPPPASHLYPPPSRPAPRISEGPGGMAMRTVKFPPEPPNVRAPDAPPTQPVPGVVLVNNSTNSGETSSVSASAQRKQWQCDWCKRLFNQKGNLVVHIRTHTGEKPYVCNICGKAFAQMSNMKRHRKTHY
mmetsp:Transcript_10469/g.20778  ORF Transcript_10469/g.20778 Transcript_10469/m.20778 type:complete len:533 (-) Transcript_10469:408-2006(-)